MTRTTWGALALLLASTSLVEAGALDRTLQPVGVIFEEGNYAELSYGFTSPSVSGIYTDPLSGGTVDSGNVGVDYSTVSLSFKYDLSDRIAVGVIVEQPFGADVNYDETDAGYPVEGSRAEFRSSSVTVLGRYKFNDNVSVYGGPRFVTIDADLFVASPSIGYTYDAEFGEDTDTGYVVGVAYEKPEIALRVALTYSSETSFANSSSYTSTFLGVPGAGGGPLDYTMPQSVNLDVRTGIAVDTLLFGSVRWADWSETSIDVPDYIFNPVVSYEEDIVTYTLGVGRKFTDQISAAASLIYEPQTQSSFDPLVPDSGVSNLSPTDGQVALQLAGTYLLGNGVELSGGVRYTRLGDATTRTIGADFSDNSAVSVGLRVGYRF